MSHWKTDKITGELEGAKVGMQYEQESGITLRIYHQGHTVELYDRTGSPILMTSENQRLLISSFTFQRGDQNLYPPNVICVKLTLSGPGQSEFETTRYVECYNFTSERDFDRIREE